MADVRSMLRAERASRRITHPHASYTTDGKLLCNLCETLVKSEAHWQSHLHSTQHSLRSGREKEAAARHAESTLPPEPGKKRKATEMEASPRDERKKAKAVTFAEPEQDQDQDQEYAGEKGNGIDAAPQATPGIASVPAATSNVTPTKLDNMDDDFAEFEREIAALEKEQSTRPLSASVNAFVGGATISAAPMTAEELAAQAREEQSVQRGKRDAELEADREDAARMLEEEFEEMESFEERVRRLRERREELRLASIKAPSRPHQQQQEQQSEIAATDGIVDEEDESDVDDDDDDGWRFGAS